MFRFSNGTVDVTANTNVWSCDNPFLLVFSSDDNSGWGITKAISEDEAKAITEDTAHGFYITALNFLGINRESI